MQIKEISKSKKPFIAVAMSGGVDSSVAALLLKSAAKPREFEKLTGRPAPEGLRDFDIRGFYLKISPNIGEGCGWHTDRRDAMHVAANQLGIPFEWIDFSDEYKKFVFEPMIADYQRGITPNPDVWCNREIKFGIFKEAMKRLGAEKIATGHYVRIEKRDDGYHLLKARDASKDQSYFLWTLTQDDLSYLVFPVGEYLKQEEVRTMARAFGLATAEKKDSQDLCMVGPLDFKDVLKMQLSRSTMGNVVLVDGGVIGKHNGLELYTIGERSGFGDGAGALYVSRKDFETGDLIVVPKNHELLFSKSAKVAKVNWISGVEPIMPFQCDAITRYHSKPIASKVTKVAHDEYEVCFETPQHAVTPGQSLVLYQGEELIGGGIIT